MSNRQQEYRYPGGTLERHLRWIEASATIGAILKNTRERRVKANEEHLARLFSKLDDDQRAAFDEALRRYTTP